MRWIYFQAICRTKKDFSFARVPDSPFGIQEKHTANRVNIKSILHLNIYTDARLVFALQKPARSVYADPAGSVADKTSRASV